MKPAKTPVSTSTASSRVGRWLSVLALLCVLALLWLWLAPGQNAAWSIPAPQVQDLHALRPQMPSLQADAVQQRALQQRLNARPLFVMGRRPPPPAPVADAAPPPEPVQDMWAQAQVLGTYASGQQSGVFLLIDGQPQRLQMGEALAGWTLQAVSPEGITLQKGRQQRELEVQKKDLTQGAGAPGKQPPGRAAVQPPAKPSPFAVKTAAPAQAAALEEPRPRQRRGRAAEPRATFGGGEPSPESRDGADDEAGDASDD